ncbi:DNA/RNA helicase [Sinorhizobium meliloti]|nr:DNA/RNA helicase [Sinorhizobium meliloti]MDW9912875.1 DNA/RNA helicase [Sinorhizobium meliloti]MDW9943977.1 DNA/RNA helicase [Sinorhizobium meliloti]
MGDRTDVLQRLNVDLIGPHQEAEILEARPSDVYLTGILWPRDAGRDPEADDSLDAESGGDEGPGESEAVRASAISRPSAAGVSFALRAETNSPQIEIEVRVATYEPVEAERAPEAESEGGATARRRAPIKWRRTRHVLLLMPVSCAAGSHTIELASPPEGVSAAVVEESAPAPPGVAVHVRAIAADNDMLVTVTLINRMIPAARSRQAMEETTLFQTELRVRPIGGTKLRARPSRRPAVDADDAATVLLYRNAHEYAAGHTCGADWTVPDADGQGGEVRATWMPRAVVPAVSSLGHAVFAELGNEGDNPLDAAWLGNAATPQMCAALRRLPQAYRQWIEQQRDTVPELEPPLQEQAGEHLKTAEAVASSMDECIGYLESDSAAADAFRIANLAMTLQFNWSKKRPEDVLKWRPFQLGFVLLTIPSLIDRTHRDRSTMDLLWFPTGGGKTEAYLALIAFLAFYRRLRNGGSPDDGAGVAAIMRYTLRLLTTQQFERAAAMILACEVLRRQDVKRLGQTPFSIGLWVGSDATPNRYADAEESLRTGNSELASPRQLVRCPQCRSSLEWRANAARQCIEVRCPLGECTLGADGGLLPVWTVDDDVYRERPTLLIGTVDKFAQIVRGVAWRSLLGLTGGEKPDLIIQDELHLISGPLGTIAGVYEAAIDRLLEVDGAPAKVIGSTATIRRAADQIRAVFDRRARLFPPPGLSAEDSGFAVLDTRKEGRLFAGISTAGRSAKFTLQAVAASILQSGAVAFKDDKDADPYKTLVSYFNSLRELGGALVLMQDDVADSIGVYARLRGEPPRRVDVVEELTSRRSQTEVREMLDKLAFGAGHPGMLDVVLASNMLSVGVDVQRLGLMLVNGQPKGIAEYIQATSRIGRGDGPGLVIAVLNNAKARDRSHYETFRTWHETLYRDVEASSVTPFAARARDRALHAVLVVLVRTLAPGMSNQPDLAIAPEEALREIRDWITGRAASVDPEEADVAAELDALFDEWRRRAPSVYWNDWRPNQSLVQSAERVAMRRAIGRAPGAAWPTMNNMRSVEPSTHFRLAEALRARATGGQGGDDGQ